MKKLLYTAILVWTVVLAAGCNDEVESQQHMTLNYEVALPIETGVSLTRSDGDPGLAEYFERPQHLYLFLAYGDPADPSNNSIYFYGLSTSQDEWIRTADSLCFKGQFSQTVNWDPELKLENLKGERLRSYVVASFDAIRFDQTLDCNEYNKVISPITKESELLNLKFYAYEGSGDYSKVSLRDIYSTPFNLSRSWSLMENAVSDRTGYYGTVESITGSNLTGIITVRDTLYHTASKVDFQWNAIEHGQTNVMRGVVVNNCPKKGYAFRPTYTTGDGSYSKVLLAGDGISASDMNNSHTAKYADVDKVDPGNQWSGRAYTYMLQPGIINYTITTSDGGSTTKESDPERINNGRTNRIFASWYNLGFNIKASNE